MSTYCISDIHGCYVEFMDLLDKICFNPDVDLLYILGDAVDRGDKPMDCLRFIRDTRNIYYSLGNHDIMMLNFLTGNDLTWLRNGSVTTLEQFKQLADLERSEVVNYLHKSPFYYDIVVDNRKFFLSHAGYNVTKSVSAQIVKDFVWSRESFYNSPSYKSHITVFGHTPTPYIHYDRNCAVWIDTANNDKICIDCGCVYGGALAALRLDDGEIFYVKSRQPGKSCKLNPIPIPETFWDTPHPEDSDLVNE